MFKAYLISVLIYTLVLYATGKLCIDKIIENGWLEPADPAPFYMQLLYSFLHAAMPVVRVFIVSGIIFLVIMPHEKEQDNDEAN